LDDEAEVASLEADDDESFESFDEVCDSPDFDSPDFELSPPEDFLA
jgi:hypothetical protein